MNQQCWCWGKDVQRPDENALMRYGFTRNRPPQGQVGATMYTLRFPRGCSLVVWGFGMWYGDMAVGGMYINRFRFAPEWTSARVLDSVIWSAEQLPLMPMGENEWPLCAHLLLPNALRCIGAYERWIIETLGLAYRRECVGSFCKPVLPAEAMADGWDDLACRLSEIETRQNGT